MGPGAPDDSAYVRSVGQGQLVKLPGAQSQIRSAAQPERGNMCPWVRREGRSGFSR
jgi:hypothetical protein